MWICGLFTTICPVKKSISSIAKFKRTIMFKKSTLIALCAIIPALGFAQDKTTDRFPVYPSKLSVAIERAHHAIENNAENRGGAVWSEDFDGAVNTLDSVFGTAGAWGKSGLNGQVWKKSTTPSNGCWSTGITLPGTSTANNGFLIFDADSANCVDPNSNPPVFNQDALLGTITSPMIDLSSTPAAVFSFEYVSRWCCAGAGLLTLVEFSGDGGATWPLGIELEHNIVNELEDGFFEANITSIMGGSSQAMFRISWDVESHYYMVVDDIMILPAPDADSKMLSAYVSHNGTGEEYGRIPMNQTDQAMLIGAQVTNFGATSQDNLELNADFAGPTPFAGLATLSMLAIGDSAFLEDASVSGPLDAGDYVGTFSVTSETDTSGGSEFGNNVLTREFEVSTSRYAIDGIGVYPNNELTDIGTDNFTGGEDGLMVLAYYDVATELEVFGIELLLGPNSSADGELIVSIHDTLEIYADNVLDPLIQSDVHVLTNAEVNSGEVTVWFDEPYDLAGNAFYAAVEMFSDLNTNDIEILDDLTVPQPGYSSMIYIPNDQVYSNGNASGVRLVLEDPNGINEADISSAISISPNPSSGLVTIKVDLAGSNRLTTEVMSIDGAVVARHSDSQLSGMVKKALDLSHLANGAYFIKITTENGVHTSKVMISK
ncbi:MAG: hypothetical protein ACI97X_001550 [Oceanospirillaceae bacterium]|jgi:hypothetical protein